MRSALTSALLFAFLPFFVMNSASAQSLSDPRSCPCTLRGIVIDSASSQPVHGALVKAFAASTWSTLTDSEGKFQFDALPAGPITLRAVKPGFLLEGASHSSLIKLGPDTPPATLKLTPEGVIFGQVTDENREPLEGFSVRLMSRDAVDPQTYQNSSLQTVTDDEGRFRIAGLQPGRYYLAVQQVSGPALASIRNPGPPQGYAHAFYPGVPDISSAVSIKVLPGRPFQANLSLRREPYLRLSGTVLGYSPEQQVQLVLEDSLGQPVSAEFVFDAPTGFFHSKWIAPGAYSLTAKSVSPISSDLSYVDSTARQPINATSDLSAVHLTLRPTVSIPVVISGLASPISSEDQGPRVILLLISRQPGVHSARSSPSSSVPGGERGYTSTVVAGLEPGAYRADFFNTGPYYVQSATWGSVDLLRDDLVVDSAGSVPPIEIALREGGATLSGTIDLEDNPVPGTVVLLPAGNQKKPRSIPSGPDGAFNIPNLAPGTYRVLAVDDFAGLDFHDPEVLQKLSSKVQEITLVANQTASLRLELAKVGD